MKMGIVMNVLLFALLTSCSKTTYLIKQGIGQVRLKLDAVDNKKILTSPIPDETKRKIHLVEAYKKYFEDYFGVSTGKIYSQTTLLKHEAVSFLVIASPYDEIKAKEFSFPFVGSFPYLGFFDKVDAKKFATKLEDEENLVTWIRPVLAYSTLGYINDPILSSFFYYDDFELAELIFHELFHTLFFIPNEVELNENLANYVGQEMALQYFGGDAKMKGHRLEERNLEKQMLKTVVDLAHEINEKLKTTKGDREKSKMLFDQFLVDRFKPALKPFCLKENCKWLDRTWNQATLAAYLTYEEKQDEISGWLDKSSMPLNQLAQFLKNHYDLYKKSDKKNSFEDYLKRIFSETHISH